MLSAGCGSLTVGMDAKPVVELIGAAVPGVLSVPCDKPVGLPDAAMSAGAVERTWGRDRTALVSCGLKHQAVVSFYSERDRGLARR